MPITAIQNAVLRLIAGNRSPDSYLAGATVLHRADDSPRYSQDVDLFHDGNNAVAMAADADAATLTEAGYDIEWLLQKPFFYRAVATKGTDRLKIEWAQDSAFRFFPILEDELCGYRLHDADAATNKLLALAGRDEIRDFVDVLHLDKSYLSLGAMAWAACGKDPGFTPDFLLNHLNRHTAYGQKDLDRLMLAEPMQLVDLKQSWLSALTHAKQLVAHLPAEEIGCLYLRDGQPVTPDPDASEFTQLDRHYGSVRGAWPTVTPAGSK